MPKRKGSRNLYERGGVWWARAKIAGRDIRRSLFTGDRKVAERRLKAFLDEVDRARAGEEPRIAYADAVIAWAGAGYGVSSPTTQRRYRVSLSMLDPEFGGRFLDEITTKTIGAYVRTRTKAVSNATVRRDLTALSRLLSYCIAMGWIDENPARNWDRSTIKEIRDPIERPDQRSVDACVETAPPMFAYLIRFLLAGGMRTEVDACALERSKINWQTGLATWRTKGGRIRTRTLPAGALGVLKEIPAALHAPASQFVFWGPDGALRETARRFEDIRARAAAQAAYDGWTFKPFTLHHLRHEYAIRFLEAGGSIYDLQRELGHTSVKTTEGYLAFLSEEQAATAKRRKSGHADSQDAG